MTTVRADAEAGGQKQAQAARNGADRSTVGDNKRHNNSTKADNKKTDEEKIGE